MPREDLGDGEHGGGVGALLGSAASPPDTTAFVTVGPAYTIGDDAAARRLGDLKGDDFFPSDYSSVVGSAVLTWAPRAAGAWGGGVSGAGGARCFF